MEKHYYNKSEVYKSAKKLDSVWTILFIDHSAYKLTLVIANYTALKPNHITFVSLLLALAAAVFFAQGSYPQIIIAAFLLQLSFLFDCIDGKLARLTRQESYLGKRLEFIRDKTSHTVSLIALTYGQLQNNNNIIIAAGSYYFLLFIYWLLYKSPYFSKFSMEPYLLIVNKRMSLIPTSVETMTIVFFVGPLLNTVNSTLITACIILFLLICYRIYILVSLSPALYNKKL